MIVIESIDTTKEDFEIVKSIRQKVFVEEQAVDPKEEFDEYEHSCKQFLAKVNGVPAGTCRYRKTENGFKLERFAVLPEHRRKGVGLAMVEKCLSEISFKHKIYLHAQLDAIPLYKKAGFKEYGPLFYECEIAHYAMQWQG